MNFTDSQCHQTRPPDKLLGIVLVRILPTLFAMLMRALLMTSSPRVMFDPCEQAGW